MKNRDPMKRAIRLSLVVVLLLIMNSPALFSQEMTYFVGPIVGLNRSNTRYLPDISPESGITKVSILGYCLGVATEIGFWKYASVEIEPMFIQKGYKLKNAKFTDGTNVFIGDETDKFDELDIPLLIKFKYPLGDVTPFAIAGPSMGFVIASTAKIDIPGQSVPDQDIKETTSSVEYGLVYGAGIQIATTPTMQLMGGIRYQSGLSNMLNNEETPNLTLKTYGLQGFLGVLFTL